MLVIHKRWVGPHLRLLCFPGGRVGWRVGCKIVFETSGMLESNSLLRSVGAFVLCVFVVRLPRNCA